MEASRSRLCETPLLGESPLLSQHGQIVLRVLRAGGPAPLGAPHMAPTPAPAMQPPEHGARGDAQAPPARVFQTTGFMTQWMPAVDASSM